MHSSTTLSIMAMSATSALAAPWNWPNGGWSGWGAPNNWGGQGNWGAPGNSGPPSGPDDGSSGCIGYQNAKLLAEAYGTLIANYTDSLANAVLSQNFTDYSESVNTLIDSCPQGSAAHTVPLLAPTFSNRSQFELGQGQQAKINFDRLNLWPACRTVTLRWESTNTAPISNPKPVVGIIVLETVPAASGNSYNGTAYPYLIDTVYSEFDAGAWLQNLEAAGICAGNPSNGADDPKPTTTSTLYNTGNGADDPIPTTTSTLYNTGNGADDPKPTTTSTLYNTGNGADDPKPTTTTSLYNTGNGADDPIPTTTTTLYNTGNGADDPISSATSKAL